MKQRPNIKIQKRDLTPLNQHRIDMLKWANRELGIIPDIVEEFVDKYKLTITTAEILFGAGSVNSRDFNIYLKGLRLDAANIVAYVEESTKNIIIWIDKSEQISEGYIDTDFDVVGKFIDYTYLINDDEDWLDTEDSKDILVNEI